MLYVADMFGCEVPQRIQALARSRRTRAGVDFGVNPFEGPSENAQERRRRAGSALLVTATGRSSHSRIGLALLAAGVGAWLASPGLQDGVTTVAFSIVAIAGWAALRRFRKV